MQGICNFLLRHRRSISEDLFAGITVSGGTDQNWTIATSGSFACPGDLV